MIKIRKMYADDWEFVKKIFSSAIKEGNSTFKTQCPSWNEWNAEHLSDCRFVIVYNGEIAGWCAISPFSSIQAYHGVAAVSIYIDSKYRGIGLGSKLFEKLCNESENLGYWSLSSMIFSTNLASISLHKKYGFRKIGYREKVAKDRFGVWKDTILMERRSNKLL